MIIAAAAVSAIKRALDSEAQYVSENNYVAAIGWVFNRNGDWKNAGPVLGFLERGKVRGAGRITCGDLEIYDNLPRDLARVYADAVLDFINGDLNFREPA